MLTRITDALIKFLPSISATQEGLSSSEKEPDSHSQAFAPAQIEPEPEPEPADQPQSEAKSPDQKKPNLQLVSQPVSHAVDRNALQPPSSASSWFIDIAHKVRTKISDPKALKNYKMQIQQKAGFTKFKRGTILDFNSE